MDHHQVNYKTVSVHIVELKLVELLIVIVEKEM